MKYIPLSSEPKPSAKVHICVHESGGVSVWMRCCILAGIYSGLTSVLCRFSSILFMSLDKQKAVKELLPWCYIDTTIDWFILNTFVGEHARYLFLAVLIGLQYKTFVYFRATIQLQPAITKVLLAIAIVIGHNIWVAAFTNAVAFHTVTADRWEFGLCPIVVSIFTNFADITFGWSAKQRERNKKTESDN